MIDDTERTLVDIERISAMPPIDAYRALMGAETNKLGDDLHLMADRAEEVPGAAGPLRMMAGAYNRVVAMLWNTPTGEERRALAIWARARLRIEET